MIWPSSGYQEQQWAMQGHGDESLQVHYRRMSIKHAKIRLIIPASVGCTIGTGPSKGGAFPRGSARSLPPRDVIRRSRRVLSNFPPFVPNLSETQRPVPDWKWCRRTWESSKRGSPKWKVLNRTDASIDSFLIWLWRFRTSSSANLCGKFCRSILRYLGKSQLS